MPEITRSYEVQEIISQVPSRILQWGMTVFFFVLITLISITWFIHYPDVLNSNVIVTTSIPPIILVTRSNGYLIVLKKENELIEKGELIAYQQTTTSTDLILELEKALNKPNEDLQIIDKSSLGDLEGDYSNFQKVLLELQLYLETTPHILQIRELQKQRASYLKLQKSLFVQRQLTLQEIKLAEEKFMTDSTLYLQQVNTKADFNKDKSSWLQFQRLSSNAETLLFNNEIQLHQLNKQISDLQIQQREQRRILEANLNHSKKTLLAHISKWKEQFLIIAETNGKLAYAGMRESGEYTEAGTAVFSILPIDGKLIAKAELPLHNSGKVKEGQRVRLYLENYPFEQYGTVTGVVSSVSLLPNKGHYLVNIALPEGLNTSQGKSLPFKQQLSGSTEIITEELRLIERFLFQFRKLIHPEFKK